jgi:hypothetical protein
MEALRRAGAYLDGLRQMTFNWLLRWLPAAVVSMSILGRNGRHVHSGLFYLGEAVSAGQG